MPGPLMNDPPWTRCDFKKNCVLAWPEGCPYWAQWKCPAATPSSPADPAEDAT